MGRLDELSLEVLTLGANQRLDGTSDRADICAANGFSLREILDEITARYPDMDVEERMKLIEWVVHKDWPHLEREATLRLVNMVLGEKAPEGEEPKSMTPMAEKLVRDGLGDICAAIREYSIPEHDGLRGRLPRGWMTRQAQQPHLRLVTPTTRPDGPDGSDPEGNDGAV